MQPRPSWEPVSRFTHAASDISRTFRDGGESPKVVDICQEIFVLELQA